MSEIDPVESPPSYFTTAAKSPTLRIRYFVQWGLYVRSSLIATLEPFYQKKILPDLL